MTPDIAIQIILAVSTFCSTVQHDTGKRTKCFVEIWHCGHVTTDSSSIPFRTKNCINRFVEREDSGDRSTPLKREEP